MSRKWSLVPLPALEDNYIWIVHDGSAALAIDPGEAAPVCDWLDRHCIRLHAIMITHHHRDHTGGVAELVRATGARVYGPADEPLPYCDVALTGNERLDRPGGLELTFDVLAIPGHTLGHLAYFGHGWLFCGDTLFSAGCGRIFEGTAEMLYHSLLRLAALPEQTAVCCAHEYTLKNLAFASVVEPNNPAICQAIARCQVLRKSGQPTLPSTLEQERKINPFLRVDIPEVAAAVEKATGTRPANSLATFTELRRWRDRF